MRIHQVRSFLYRSAIPLAGVALAAVASAAENKVTICHRPPGNPDNVHTLSVGEAAVGAHLRHGDGLGACPTGCGRDPRICDDGDACTVDACDAEAVCHHLPVSGDPVCNFCGDGLAQPLEDCDGQDLKGETCTTLLGPAFAPAGLTCTASCQFDTSQCLPPDPGED